MDLLERFREIFPHAEIAYLCEDYAPSACTRMGVAEGIANSLAKSG